MIMITLKEIKKTYKNGVHALKGISFDVNEGEFFGLLGPNGAGKSTTIGILSNLITQYEGDITINGYNIRQNPIEAKRLLGVVPQEFNFNIFDKCINILINQAGFYGVPYTKARHRAEELLKQLGIWDKHNCSARELSGGMKRRLMIARALVHNPKILILDEPTAGVDISLRRHMYAFLEEENKNGLTIILTTHYLEEAEQLCERIAIIDKGKVIENNRTEILLKKLKSEVVVLYTENPVKIPENTAVKQIDETTLELELTEHESISHHLSVLADQGIDIYRMRNKANRLEEMFLKLVEGPPPCLKDNGSALLL